jgi:ABC-type tungstate transport system permease subunit
VGGASKEFGGVSKEFGAVSKESGAVSKESGAVSKEFRGVSKEPGDPSRASMVRRAQNAGTPAKEVEIWHIEAIGYPMHRTNSFPGPSST